jgi:hypothetical protein
MGGDGVDSASGILGRNGVWVQRELGNRDRGGSFSEFSLVKGVDALGEVAYSFFVVGRFSGDLGLWFDKALRG